MQDLSHNSFTSWFQLASLISFYGELTIYKADYLQLPLVCLLWLNSFAYQKFIEFFLGTQQAVIGTEDIGMSKADKFPAPMEIPLWCETDHTENK